MISEWGDSSGERVYLVVEDQQCFRSRMDSGCVPSAGVLGMVGVFGTNKILPIADIR